MSKYRFKTQEEFIRDGQWEDDNHCPEGWSISGDMNHYLGQDVPEGANESCDLREGFDDDGWWFEPTNYVLKEEDYTGRWIKALVDSPQCTGVKAGEVIKIIGKPNSYRLDKTASGVSEMSIPHPLQTSKWELIEEPKDNYDGILEKARRLYPIGTEFISNLGSFDGVIQTVKDELNWYNENKDSISHPGIGWVYFDGKWAEIVKPASSKVVPGYVRCVQALMNAKVGTVYPVVDEMHCLCEDGNTYVWNALEFTPATKQEYDAQFTNEQDPLYICKQKYRKGMKVRSACKGGYYAGEFIIDLEPSEFRNLAGKKNVVDYSFSNGYLYFNGEYAEILEEGIYDISEIIKTNKPSIETVHSVDVNLRTKKQINKFKF